MSSKKLDFEDSILAEVVATGKCASCGTCVVACPFGSLELAQGKPNLVKECKVCGICAQVCPRYNWYMAEAEKAVFGRERKPEEEFGVYRKIVIAQAKPDAIQKARQDGGVATALLASAMQSGMIDGAIVSGVAQDKPFYPVPMLATTPQKIIEAAGTKYTCSSSLLALPEIIKQKKTKVALVGTPCQIHAVRKMQMSGVKKYTGQIKFLVGLMCSECFDYEGLMETHIRGKLGINPADIKKINIKGKMLVTTPSGTTAIPLAEIKQYARKSCSVCEDFSSELADISVGGLGLDGWTFTIIRTVREYRPTPIVAPWNGGSGFAEGDKTEAHGLLLKLSKKKRGTAAGTSPTQAQPEKPA